MSIVPPVHREILVDADPAAAFEVFTAGIGRWWPLASNSVYETESASVGFVDGQILERSADGSSALWGTVTRWEPAVALAFTWHPGKSPERASHVEVTFTAAATQTLVTLEHTGWEVFADPAAARAEYNQGWPLVLDLYREHAGQRGDDVTWVALMHRPGSAAPQDAALTDDPRFAEHVAFLGRMKEAGYLVAAGPLPDKDGEGMTILRLPGSGQLEAATRLATEDDASVVGGLLAVTVRHWLVVLQA
ncbi:MAG TPA: SRPBCC domain-containing protein [Streptosporangiaceae bacterium]|jgi:uncharacterized protein YciI|nr:SRPBCC domain-containing protein [Streptosporangiaceae bacterium]